MFWGQNAVFLASCNFFFQETLNVNVKNSSNKDNDFFFFPPSQ